MDSPFKMKYKNRIKELMDAVPSESSMDSFMEEMDKELKSLKKEKKERLIHYQKILKYYVIIADIILFVAIGVLVLGIYMKTYWDVKMVWPALVMTLSALLLVASGTFFGLAEYNREQRHKYFKEMPSDSDISSLLSMEEEMKEEYRKKYKEREDDHV